MYNPQFIKTIEMCQTMMNHHHGEIETLKLTWGEIKDPCGNVLQIIPLLDIQFKF